jgi:hypothetical protein
MVPFFGRFQPRTPLLAAVYWVLVVVVLLGLLSAVFFFLDDYLPGQGMF